MPELLNVNVILIDPPHHPWEFFRGVCPCNGLLAIAAHLEKHFDLTIIDGTALDRSWYDVERILRQKKPDAICVSGNLTTFANEGLQTAALVRTLIYPDVPIIGGGPHFTFTAEAVLRTGNFDFIVLGEGEQTTLELLTALKEKTTDFSAIRGIAYLDKEGRYVRTPERPLIEDLDSLNLPAYHLFPMDRYYMPSLGGNVAIAVCATRGCNHRCSFCSEAHFWNSTVRGYSGRRTAEILELLVRKYGKKSFYVGDNNFLWSRERNLEFLEEMEKRKLGCYMWLQVCAHSAIENEDLLPRFKRIGVYQIMIGLESVNARVLKTYGKPQDLELMKKAIKAVKGAGISMFGCTMWGDPDDDTPETLKAMLKFIRENCDYLAPNLTTPFPGTAYYESLEKRGLLKVRDWKKYNFSHALMPSKELDIDQTERVFEELCAKEHISLKYILKAFLAPTWVERAQYRAFLKMGYEYSRGKRYRRPGYITFEEYMRQTGREEPEWRDAISMKP